MRHALTESEHPERIHFYSSSGGNAGLACATAAITLQRPATIVVPESTSRAMIERLRSLGAQVMQHGKDWRAADEFLRSELLAKDAYGVYVAPFDDPRIWQGHASLVDEMEVQMAPHGGYDAVVCSVGGGGLLNGIMEGLEKHNRIPTSTPTSPSLSQSSVRVLATETIGADSLHHAVKTGNHEPLPGGITSIATTLGSVLVSARSYQWAMASPNIVRPIVISDADAAMSCVRLATDEKLLVEPACGVSLAAVYNGAMRQTLFAVFDDEAFRKVNVVVVVCGGSGVDLESLNVWRKMYIDDEGVRKWWKVGQ